MKHLNKVSFQIRKAIFEVNNNLGSGLNESVYEEALIMELKSMGLKVERQVELPVIYKGTYLQKKFIVDLIIDGMLIVEIKSVDKISDIHKSQLLNYLKLSGIKLGILVNFNTNFIKDNIDIFRIINSQIEVNNVFRSI